MRKEKTVERTYLYHLYYLEGSYFVDFYDNKICAGYQTEAGAREAIYYHFN